MDDIVVGVIAKDFERILRVHRKILGLKFACFNCIRNVCPNGDDERQLQRQAETKSHAVVLGCSKLHDEKKKKIHIHRNRRIEHRTLAIFYDL